MCGGLGSFTLFQNLNLSAWPVSVVPCLNASIAVHNRLSGNLAASSLSGNLEAFMSVLGAIEVQPRYEGTISICRG